MKLELRKGFPRILEDGFAPSVFLERLSAGSAFEKLSQKITHSMWRKKTKPSGSHGFTLIELLIAIAIITILVSIVLAYLSGAKAKGRDARRIADIKQIEQGLEMYFSNCNAYPLTLSSLLSDCTGSKILTAISTDPLPSRSYSYAVNDSPVEYHLCATLELGYAGGTGKSGHPALLGNAAGTIRDTCNGADPSLSIFDRYGP